MKKILSLTLLAVPMFGLTINFSKTFDSEIKPDTLQAGINITVKKPSEKDTIEGLARFSTFMDNANEVKVKGGNYNVYPDYRYENNHRYKSGYVGNINYKVSAKESTKLNNFLTSLYGFKTDKTVDIRTSSVSWMMSEEQKVGKIDALRLEAIKWADGYANSLSDSLTKKCEVKAVTFTPVNHYYPQPEMMRSDMQESKAMAPTPKQDIQKISLNPTITLECR